MKKTNRYQSVRFDVTVLRAGFERFLELRGENPNLLEASVTHDDGAKWSYDELEEFFADYRKFPSHATLLDPGYPKGFHFETHGAYAYLQVQLADRTAIEQVFSIFDDAVLASTLEPSAPPPEPVKIFIGHGRSEEWIRLRDHLRDQHKFDVIAYESGARAGHTIRDILEEMAAEATFAILVFTGEDQQADGRMRTRQNVIHETGLFQGRLGFSRAIILLEDGVENLSNVEGIQYISFGKGNIREAFGDVVATVRREFFS